METSHHAVVANTDAAWFAHFRPEDELQRVDEVNHWRPRAQQQFNALTVGEPFFFRLKQPINAVAGFGFFALQTFLPISLAWQVFGDKNGDPTYDRFLRRIAGYRGVGPDGLGVLAREPLNCLVLREAVFLPEAAWLPWGERERWARNIVGYKGFDLTEGSGRQLAALLQAVPQPEIADLAPAFEPLPLLARETAVRAVVTRAGQGTFRVRLIRAYEGRCAVTGERSIPALDAAHIQPYVRPASNHLQNGLLLRADLHRLYDAGYLTVTPDLRVEVSPRLRDEFENGRIYYALAGQRITVPLESSAQPSRAALAWHASHVFR